MRKMLRLVLKDIWIWHILFLEPTMEVAVESTILLLSHLLFEVNMSSYRLPTDTVCSQCRYQKEYDRYLEILL